MGDELQEFKKSDKKASARNGAQSCLWRLRRRNILLAPCKLSAFSCSIRGPDSEAVALAQHTCPVMVWKIHPRAATAGLQCRWRL